MISQHYRHQLREVVDLNPPELAYRWVGGYGWGDSPVSLEVMHQVDGVEISVETNLREHSAPADHRRRLLLFDLMFREVAGSGEPISLPMTWTASEATLEVEVDGVPTVFEGVALDGGDYAGVTQVGENLTLVLKVRGSGVTPKAIATCTNWAMPDMGPQLD